LLRSATNHTNQKLFVQKSKRMRKPRSRNPSRSLQPCKTEANSKNSTIVHQCKASVGTERPTPELGQDDPYGGTGPCYDFQEAKHHSSQLYNLI